MSRILFKTVLRSYTIVSDKDTHVLLHIFHLPPGLKSVGVFREQLWRVQQLLCSSRSQTSLSHFLLMYLIISWSIHLLRYCWFGLTSPLHLKLQLWGCIWWVLLGSPVCAQNDHLLFLGWGGGGKERRSFRATMQDSWFGGGSPGNFSTLNNDIQKLTLVLCEAEFIFKKKKNQRDTHFFPAGTLTHLILRDNSDIKAIEPLISLDVLSAWLLCTTQASHNPHPGVWIALGSLPQQLPREISEL